MDSNQARRLNAATWPLTSFAGLILMLRLIVKFRRHRRLWFDDYILTIAWICLLTANAIYTYDAAIGFGKHASDGVPENLELVTITTNIGATFFNTALALAKTSFAVTLLRIMSGFYVWLLWFVIVSMNLAQGGLVILQWVKCHPVAKAWEPGLEGYCLDKPYFHYAIFAVSYSGAMDLLLALLPWTIFWSLMINTKEKIGIALAMSMGVFACFAAIIKAYEIMPMAMASGDYLVSYQACTLLIWGVAEASVTIIAASLPVLRTLIASAPRVPLRFYRGPVLSDGDGRYGCGCGLSVRELTSSAYETHRSDPQSSHTSA